MKQESLLEEPRIEFTHLGENAFRRLEDIALKATEHELLYKEPLGGSPEERLNRITQYLPSRSSQYAYYIMFGEEPIGFVSIWDGWIAVEMDYVFPQVEVAFMAPEHKQYEPVVRQQIRDLLRATRENQE